MIEKANEFGALSLVELSAFEEVNNIELPTDYRRYLLRFNGGKPFPNRTNIPEVNVNYILGMHNGEYYASLYKHIDMYKNRLPFGTFPIATDHFGNLFIMSVHPESKGNIYFWDHEKEPVIQDGHYTANCIFVAYTFESFLENLS